MSLSNFYKGKKVLVTAGPTYEKIDPVRFIGNYSTGKMGGEIAMALANEGAEVFLVLGPTNLEFIHPNITCLRVESAIEMFEACKAKFDDIDIAVLSAAVADYRPATVANEKIKKSSDEMTLTLVKNPDILYYLGHNKKHQKVIGFALETENELANAKLKLEKKKADAIILNSLRDEGSGFKTNTNKIAIITIKGSIFEFPLKSKKEVAQDIIKCVSEL